MLSILEVGVVLILTGVIGGCWMWFLRGDKRVTRTVDEAIRGGRFTGRSEEDRPRLMRDVRLGFALGIGMCVLVATFGVAILVKGLVG